MIGASHGNSGKDFRRQPAVASAIADQVAAGISIQSASLTHAKSGDEHLPGVTGRQEAA